MRPWINPRPHQSNDLRQVTFANPVGMELLAAFFVGSFIGVSAEVVALSLKQVGWQGSSAVAIKVGQCRAEGGNR